MNAGGWLAKLLFALAWLITAAVAATIPLCSWLGGVQHVQALKSISDLFPRPYYFATAIGGVSFLHTTCEFLLDKHMSPSLGRVFLWILLSLIWFVLFVVRSILFIVALLLGLSILSVVAGVAAALTCCGYHLQDVDQTLRQRWSRCCSLLLIMVWPGHQV